MRKLLFIAVLIPILGGIGWWYFREQSLPDYGPAFREYAYVSNGDSGTVTVLDVVNLRIDREVPVGEHPVAVAISPTRNEVYVVNEGGANGSLSVINAEKNAVAATIQLRRAPISIEVDAGGKLAYVANSGSNAVSIIDLVARRRNLVAFVEVKARATLDDAAYAVTPRQQRRIIDAAQAWLMAHPEHAEFELRFDAMLIAPRRLPRHLLAAFDAST